MCTSRLLFQCENAQRVRLNFYIRIPRRAKYLRSIYSAGNGGSRKTRVQRSESSLRGKETLDATASKPKFNVISSLFSVHDHPRLFVDPLENCPTRIKHSSWLRKSTFSRVIGIFTTLPCSLLRCMVSIPTITAKAKI